MGTFESNIHPTVPCGYSSLLVRLLLMYPVSVRRTFYVSEDSTNRVGGFTTMKNNKARCSIAFGIAVLAVMACGRGAVAQDAVSGIADAPVELDIQAQPIGDALNALAQQSGLQVVFFSEVTGDLQSREAVGKFESSEAALEYLLADTGLGYRFVNERTVAVQGPSAVVVDDQGGDSDSKNLELSSQVLMAQNQTSPTQKASSNESDERSPSNSEMTDEERAEVKLPEIIVYGNTINADIRRSENDAQPYVVFGEDEISASLDITLDGFLKKRLPMNAVQFSSNLLQNSEDGNRSGINLRGLGTNQTLVLVNGRRMPSVYEAGADFTQADINGIPISSIERIEVLPSTASGIYGGGATGGAVNIVLKRDYRGAELGFSYDDTFDGSAPTQRIDASAGFSMFRGRTNVLLSGSYSTSDPLLTGDRNFAARARALQIANNPDAFTATIVPPSGFTTNIHSFGPDLFLDDGTPLGSPFTSVPVGYAGAGSDGGQAFVANAGTYNLDIPNDFSGLRSSLINNPTITSASASVRHDITGDIEGYIDLSFYENDGKTLTGGFRSNLAILPADAPNNPFDSTVIATFPTPGITASRETISDTRVVAAGLIAKLSENWRTSLDITRSRAESQTSGAFNVFSTDITTALGNGALDVLRDVNAFPLNFSPFLLPQPEGETGPYVTNLEYEALRISGSIDNSLGGPITLVALLETRRTEGEAVVGGREPFLFYVPGRSQDVTSAYVEAVVPLITSRNSRPRVQLLDIQIAARYDKYETTTIADSSFRSLSLSSVDSPLPDVDFQSTDLSSADYTVGLRYSPVQDLILRASHGTGFLPPSTSQLVPTLATSPFIFLPEGDPQRGSIPGTIGPLESRIVGGNPLLNPEESKCWSAGIIFTPQAVPGLRLSLDFTRIDKVDEIGSVDAQTIINSPDKFPGRVIRGPLTPEDEALGYTAGPIVSFDDSLLNLAATSVEAYDLQANYTVEWSGFGAIDVYAVVTQQTKFEQQTLSSEPIVDRVGFINGPLKLRGNIGATWNAGAWTAGWNAQYYDSHFVYTPTTLDIFVEASVLSQGSDTVPSQTYHDAFGEYRFDELDWAGSILSGTSIRIGIRNVFDKSPPILASTAPSQGFSGYGDPRMRSFSVSIRKSF